MADKPRVKAPKKRVTHTDRSVDNRRILMIAGGSAMVLIALVGAFFLLGAAKGTDANAARDALAAAGCTFEVEPAVRNVSDHSDFPDPAGTSKKWNTDPPTSGPHYGQTVIYGAYTELVEIGRLVHNLEHGGVFILYGNKVPEATVAQLQGFYDKHRNGSVMAPYPKLGNKIALGAWLVDGLPQAASDRGSGVLAKCTRFDNEAFDAFFDAFQFKGPESFAVRPSEMEPGEN
jgi:uncharacterized protein DUF3105